VIVLAPSHVLTAIDLDRESGFDAIEIHDVWADGNLSSETEALQLFAAKVVPQAPLGV